MQTNNYVLPNKTTILPNQVALKLLRIIMTLFSVMSLSILAYKINYSPSIKIVLNTIIFSGINIGLPVLILALGYGYCIPEKYTWKGWMKKHMNFYRTWYFYIALVIVIGWIGIGILQSRNDPLLAQPFTGSQLLPDSNIPNPQSNSSGWNLLNFGYPLNVDGTNNVNSWYGMITLFSIIPAQNFYLAGTTFLTTFFWFIMIAPFIWNWMNKLSFGANTTIVVSFIIGAMFFSYWGNAFQFGSSEANAAASAAVPGHAYVTEFTKWMPTVTYFLLGWYLKRYVRLISWKITLGWFVGIAVGLFIAESALDEGLKSQSNYQYFYLSASTGAAFPNVVLAVLLFYGILALPQKKTPRLERFVNFHAEHIIDEFIQTQILARMLFGVVILHFGAHLDVIFVNSDVIEIPGTINNTAVPGFDQYYGWLIFIWAIFAYFLQYVISLGRRYFYVGVDKGIAYLKSKRKNGLKVQ
ncbi:hypothetical protein [[Mycoplasma] testudinis]|uniref:hypothetical protein n=1 Tax=[Mycoplasma] testudinis TaxID=33924 RepID=UPI0004804D4F|nr:hypothetical protein [[Mycoplasma] testudinis]